MGLPPQGRSRKELMLLVVSSLWLVTRCLSSPAPGPAGQGNIQYATPADQGHDSSSLSSSSSSSPVPNFLPVAGEEIGDARCTMDDLERANDMQLHVIFTELQLTNFFQHFVVDLEHKCPLSGWTGSGGHGAGGGSSNSSTVGPSPGQHDKEASASNPRDGDDDFHCGGSEELGLDEDAEPLCTVETGDDATVTTLFGGSSKSLFGGSSDDGESPIESNVLQSLSQKGFSSKRQQDTFDWRQQTDIVVEGDDAPCDDGEVEVGSLELPDTFWLDICSNIHEGDGTKLVNLALNPERNTGYNGTHIWKAIYEENCITTEDSCLEQRVLYKLLSGMHTSTTLSIARNYYPPSKRKNRTDWEANPAYFMEKFQNHPDHIRNLHFSYVVMLRAIKKASEYLYHYDMKSGNVVEDETSHILLKRLLDTAILRSCSNVFFAFDESVMFNDDYESNNVLLQQSFKGVFHNISSILDCVQCQQCKLHGKLTMLGYGTALKILFVKSSSNLVLERNEVVALINTAARLSESLVQVRELTAMYWHDERNKLGRQPKIDATATTSSSFPPGLPAPLSPSYDSMDMVDITVGAIARLGQKGLISMEREKELIEMALARNPELMILAKHYQTDPERLASMSTSLGWSGSNAQAVAPLPVRQPDAVVVGSGLAGLAASLNILDRGGTVVIVEKEHLLGGNSNKASSGINGCCPQNDTYDDSLESFRNDTIRSAGEVADLNLINVLIEKSEKAVLWLKDRANVDLSLVSQLGGHSHKRTHRPSNGMAGAEIIYHLQKAVRSFEKTGRLKILVDTRVKELVTEKLESGSERVVGVLCESTKDGTVHEILADNVVLATGGFASDRSPGSYLDKHRPELMAFPATAGGFSTGDGITLATTLGAATRDMDKVQIHPTGWVDPKDPTNPTKVLAAELMRGVGGILIDRFGKRFCNELGTRAYVTDQMLKHDEDYASTGHWNRAKEVPTFFLVLSSAAAADAKKHVDLYTHKGLLTKVTGVDALSKHMELDKETVRRTLQDYQSAAINGTDSFGKSSFRGIPAEDLDSEIFFVGMVTPVLHYCMGGIKIDTEGNVIREDGTTIEGLHAAGEVSGGVHGKNRLGGNSLLECTVFGTIVGQKLPIKEEGTYRIALGADTKKDWPVNAEAVLNPEVLPKITVDELSKHNTKEDIWVAIHGVVYDFTEFALEHPAGFQSIFDLAGTDGTDAFDSVHNLGMLDDFEEDKRGILVM